MRATAVLSKYLTLIFLTTLVACGGGSQTPVVDTDADGVADSIDNCVNAANADQADSDANGEGDECDEITKAYAYTNSTYSTDADSVSYTGQVARQLLILGLVNEMTSLQDTGTLDSAAVVTTLSNYISNPELGSESNILDGENHTLTAIGYTAEETGGSAVAVKQTTYGAVSTGKSLDGKIAGGDINGNGQVDILIGEFFGWTDGITADQKPINLVDLWINRLATQATDGEMVSYASENGPSTVNNVLVDAQGRDYRQLLQKFLLGAVNFSQGTNKYWTPANHNTTWDTMLAAREKVKDYNQAEHDFDEGFGYFGAARDILDYDDVEARAKSGRPGWNKGYHDTNGDNEIDLAAEYNFGHSQNCAKRDVGASVEGTDLQGDVMAPILAARQIISNASNRPSPALTSAEADALQAHIKSASVAWEKCIAATVIHYINDLTKADGDYAASPDGYFSSAEAFTNLAKHWSEAVGFALSLQFSPYSPFRDESVTAVNLDDLKSVLSAFGNSPVLADGSQDGTPVSGGETAQSAIAAYTADLLQARDTLKAAYGFANDNVINW